ncbi:MAG: DUF11 domain-containing protein [Candidatus Anammoximicrobium sp.]|nr:DUF11 domain-containing protein [Candidatus Anammoximicrobium sp.]
MNGWSKSRCLPLVSIVAVATMLAGCAPLRLPRIDPSGERIFLPHGNYTEFVAPQAIPYVPEPAFTAPPPVPPCPPSETSPSPLPPACGAAEPLCGPAPAPSCSAVPAAPAVPAPAPVCAGLHREKLGRLVLAPAVMMAPVGSEVVILSGLADAKGDYIPRQPLEWSLTPDSVGHIVEAGEERPCLKALFRQASSKRDGSYAVTRSLTQTKMLSRGTPNPADDVSVQRGQSWVTITSPTEGASFVGVVAPEAEIWDQRRQTSTIYWVDVQWLLPSPAVVLAAQPHALSTTVRRRSGKPLAGWIVRYEILDPNVTSFGPNKQAAVDVKTDDNGVASINLVPARKSSSTQVRISIVRPSLPNDELPPMVVGQGYTSVTWSAPDPKVTLYGPESAGAGSTVTYRAEVSNAGDIVARRLIASATVPANMTFLSSDPPAQVLGNTLRWDLNDLPPKAMRQLTIHLRADRNASVRFCVRADSGEPAAGQKATAEACVATRVFSSTLRLTMSGPETAQVDQQVRFEIELTNTGTEPLKGVVIRDRLPAGLEHPTERGSLIERSLGETVPAGSTRKIAVALIVTQAGRWCHTVEAVAEGGHSATASGCVTAAEPPRPEPKPAVEAAIEGPAQAKIGERVTFTLQATNTGNVPLTNVRVVGFHDRSLYPRRASTGYDAQALTRGELLWLTPRLMPGETVTRQAELECVKDSASSWCRVFVETGENVRAVKEVKLVVQPAAPKPAGPKEPPPRIEPPRETPPEKIVGELKVSIADRQDPISVNGTTTYIVAVENGRNVGDKNVVLTVLLPPGLEFVNLRGPVSARAISPDGRTVEAEPVKEMRPGEMLNPFFIEVKGARIGKHILKVRVDSFRSSSPAEAEEDTTVNVSG